MLAKSKSEGCFAGRPPRPNTSPSASWLMRMESEVKIMVYDDKLDGPAAGNLPHKPGRQAGFLNSMCDTMSVYGLVT